MEVMITGSGVYYIRLLRRWAVIDLSVEFYPGAAVSKSPPHSPETPQTSSKIPVSNDFSPALTAHKCVRLKDNDDFCKL